MNELHVYRDSSDRWHRRQCLDIDCASLKILLKFPNIYHLCNGLIGSIMPRFIPHS